MSDGPPQGWATAPLDSLCQKFRGVSYGRDEASADPKKDYVPILRANNLQDDRLVFDDLVWVPERCVSDQQKLRTGDIVIAMSSGSKSVVGKTAQVMEDWRGSFGAFCGALRPWPELNSRYVGLFLRTREYRNTISELAAGSNINNLKNEHLAAIEVPVAPLAEQRRIVEKLEKLLGQVDACQQRLAKIPTLLKRFHQSVLAAACSGRLTGDWREENEPEESAEDLLNRVKVQRAKAMNVGNKRRLPPAVLDVPELPEIPEFWWWATLDQIVEEGRPIIYGIIKPGPHDPKGVPYVRVFEMKDGKVAPLSELKRASLERASKFTRATLKGGDLLISKDGTIGRVAIVPPELEGGNITQHLVRASIHPFLCRDYVACAIRSQKSQNWLFGKKRCRLTRRERRRLPAIAATHSPAGRATGNRAASGGPVRAGEPVGAAAGAGAPAGGSVDAVPPRPRLRRQTRPSRPHRRTSGGVARQNQERPTIWQTNSRSLNLSKSSNLSSTGVSNSRFPKRE